MIFNNKKGQNITKPFTIVLILVVVAVISMSFMKFGEDLASDPNNNLNDESKAYIYAKSGFTPNSNISSSDQNDLFFSSKLNSSGNAKDYALEFEFYREQSSGIRTIIQDVWNLPTFFIDGLNLDRNNWEVFIQILLTLIWVLVFYAIYRLIRGII